MQTLEVAISAKADHASLIALAGKVNAGAMKLAAANNDVIQIVPCQVLLVIGLTVQGLITQENDWQIADLSGAPNCVVKGFWILAHQPSR